MTKITLRLFLVVAVTIQVSLAKDISAQVKSVKDVKLSLFREDIALLDVFQEIEESTDFTFNFSQVKINLKEKVSLKYSDTSLEKILLGLSREHGLAFKQVNNNIGVFKAEKNKTQEEITLEILADVEISGKITDENGQGLPGASVVVKGTTNGATTDLDGNYNLNIPEDALLVISFVGYKTKELEIAGRSTIDVQMELDAEQLEEVVVIGYGTAKLKNITGAVAKVDLEDSPISFSQNTNALQALRGNLAGVNVGTQNSVGETPNLLIRGQNSINGSNAPLIVLDGVIFLGNINDINPSDIADVSVLKDASAAATYGSRSANGVIMINTKKGKTDKPSIRYSTKMGINSWKNKPDLMRRDRWAEKFAAQNNFASADDIVMPDEAGNLMLAQEDLDLYWPDLISRNGMTQEHQVSVSGRSDKINYFFSGGYMNQEGAMTGDDYQRISGRVRLDTDITNWLEVSVDGTYNNNDYSGLGPHVGNAMRGAPSAVPFIYEDWPNNAASNLGGELARWPRGQSIPNPLWDTNKKVVEDINKNNFYRFAGNALFKVPAIDGLTYKLNYATYQRATDQDRFYNEGYYIQEHANPPFYDVYLPSQVATGLTQANGYNRDIIQNNYVVDNIINYNQEFDKHYVDLTLVATRDYTSTRTSELLASDFSTNGNTILSTNGLAFAANQIYSLNIVERANIGYLGRISYTYDGKYHFNASIRRDGASVFGADQKWGSFPSAGVAWTVSEERFLENIDIIDYLKVNASFGVNGNQGVGPYGTLSRVQSGPSGNIPYEFGDDPSTLLWGIRQQTLATPSLGWERTASFNGGIQSTWLDGRVSMDLNFYFSKTTDQIFSRQIPIMTGFNSIVSSLGQVDNNGLEINLRGNIIQREDFTWTGSLNFWRNRNVVASLYGDDLDGDGNEDDDIGNNLFIGESLGAIYGYDFIGVVQEDDIEYINNNSAEPGDPMFRDMDGDNVITAEDRAILGFNKENFRFGFANTLSYKDFSLYVMIAGIAGGNGFYQKANPYATSFTSRFDTNELDHPWWTPENQSNEYLRVNYIGGRYLGLESRGFVRIQDVVLTYTLPSDLLSKIGVQSLKLNVAARNLYTFTGWTGEGDPEEGVAALQNTYPVPTVYSMGLNVSF
ncbi:MAG: TonB-dependent receptor [Cyclobacteriaceae bacterium]